MQDTEILVPEDLGSNAVATPEPSAPPAPETGSDTGKEQTPQPETAERQEPEKAEPDNEDQKDGLSKEEREARRVQQRFDRLTREKWTAIRGKEESDRRIAERDAELERLRAQISQNNQQENPEQPRPLPRPDPRAVHEEARALLKQQAFEQNCDHARAVGFKEFPDWNDATEMLGTMGAVRPEVLNPVFDVCRENEIEPHKVLYALGKNPDETARIFSLPEPHLVGAALTRFANKVAATPAPVPPASKAPAPIKPVAGATRVDPDDSKLSDEAWWEKERKASKG